MPTHEKEATKSTSHSRARRRLVLDEGNKAKTNDTSNIEKNEKRQPDSYISLKQDQVFLTPQKKKLQSRPGKEPTLKRKKTEDVEYVPKYIHKNVEYSRKGESNINSFTKKASVLVEKHFVIPEDFEKNRKYGPLSGSSFEERCISAYMLNLLHPNIPESSVAICCFCAEEGHRQDDCMLRI